MSKPNFPVGHPFAGNLPVGVSPFDVGTLLIDYHRNVCGGWTMKEDDDEDDDDDDDDELDGDTIIKVGDKEIAVKDLQRIMAKEKRQGRSSGTRQTLEALGFDSLDDAKAFIEQHKKPKKKKSGDGGDDEADEKARKREEAANARETRAKAAERKADLKAALSAEGVSKDDMEDAVALLDRAVDAEYDDDDLDDAVEELRERRPALFGDDDEEGDEENGRKRKPARGRIPSGRPPKKKAGAKSAWQRGEELAKKRHGIKD